MRPSDSLLPLRIACGIGLADALVALTTAVVSRPHAASIVLGALWAVAWGAAFARVPALAPALARRPWILLVAGVGGTALAVLDGGFPGNLGTQPTWVVVVAAAAGLGVRFTLGLGLAVAGAKAATFLAAGMTPAALTGPGTIGTETLAPLPIAALALVFVAALRTVLAAFHTEMTPRAVSAPALSPAERAVVELLAGGLTPKQIAARRGTSVDTVRTQIKRAKRTSGARTLDELVATAWRPAS